MPTHANQLIPFFSHPWFTRMHAHPILTIPYQSYKWSTTRFSLNCTHPLVGISGYVRGRLDSWERGLGLWVSSWKKSGDDDDTGVVCRQGSIDVPWKGVYSTWSRVGSYACPLYAFMRIMWVSGRGETDAVGWEGEADGGVYRVWVEVRGM